MEVINGSDGKRLGHIIDLIFDTVGGIVRGIVLPLGKKNFFSKSQDLFVPWSCVQKIGEDVILVEIDDINSGAPVCRPKQPPKPDKKPHDTDGDCAIGGQDVNKCDGICEKCMLFDCSRRWETFAAST